ncbi:YdaS family helix-turn-helix protein [Cupriavidus malaysiensis]|uniref:transcriptional regulator n=1 Tax=Cupriavidus malaysiensis TaxID=367825 RepID=UPI000A05C181
MDLRTYLRAERGRAAELARHLGVTPTTVNEWATLRKPVRECYAPLIEGWSHGAVPREVLRPLDWHIVWPELRLRSVAPADTCWQSLAAACCIQ